MQPTNEESRLFSEIIELKKDKRDLESHLGSLREENSALVECLEACVHYLEMYNGKNPESPYKSGVNNCYILGAGEAEKQAFDLLAKVKEKL